MTDINVDNRCLFPSGLTEETLFSVHEAKQLNPNIALGFFRAGLVERFGSGIQKIVVYCKENGNPVPRYSISSDMITLKMESRIENIKLAFGEDKKCATSQLSVISVTVKPLCKVLNLDWFLVPLGKRKRGSPRKEKAVEDWPKNMLALEELFL